MQIFIDGREKDGACSLAPPPPLLKTVVLSWCAFKSLSPPNILSLLESSRATSATTCHNFFEEKKTVSRQYRFLAVLQFCI